ncbi:MAG: molybdopterin-dependent oxidoreductase [Proteobacteria bacterium]|nr:molybdopterin-dependent oxidoreductase [Pseudomonadota bacterium]
MSAGLGRRAFLKSVAALAGSLSLSSFTLKANADSGAMSVPSYGSWQDIYRGQWSWDRVVRSTHHFNCWFQAHCAWDVYVKDGIVFREEQAGEYEQVNAELPDYNPRGCQKGGCFSQRMYDATRITHPLRRVGPRGGGRWERVSWDEALDDIADTYLDVTIEEGTDRTIWDLGPGIDLGVSMAAQGRFSKLTQSIGLDMDGEIGDSRRGTLETFGKIVFERSADDYFYADLILFWGGNPVYTQIPQAHFFTEARYRGARIVSITPDYNPSATKADQWIPIKPGTDAALALALCHEIVAGDHVDTTFVKEQTDLPLLVRSDTRHFLKQSDVVQGGRDDHYLLGTRRVTACRRRPFAHSRSTRSTRARHPPHGAAGERRYGGGGERVRPVARTPGRLHAAGRQRDVRHRRRGHPCPCRADRSSQAGIEHFTDQHVQVLPWQSRRAQRRAVVRADRQHRRGANFSGFLLTPDGGDKFTIAPTLQEAAATFGALRTDDQAASRGRRHTGNDRHRPRTHDVRPRKPVAAPADLDVGNPVLVDTRWCRRIVRPGANERLGTRHPAPAVGLRRRVARQALAAIAAAAGPSAAHHDPLCSNPLRRARGSQKLLEVLWPKLKKAVVLDWRISSTARHADYVLPVAPWYERTGIKWVTPLSPYLTVTEQATPARRVEDRLGHHRVLVAPYPETCPRTRHRQRQEPSGSRGQARYAVRRPDHERRVQGR